MIKRGFSDFYDRIAQTILCAPDNFSPFTDMTLDKAFLKLNEGLEGSHSIVGEHFNKFKEHLDLSLAAYKKNDIKEGIRHLQVIDNIIREEIR